MRCHQGLTVLLLVLALVTVLRILIPDIFYTDWRARWYSMVEEHAPVEKNVDATPAPNYAVENASRELPTKQRTLFVAMETNGGRLGNHMFAYAALYGIAKKTGAIWEERTLSLVATLQVGLR